MPVGLRDVLPNLQRWPYVSVGQALQNVTSQWTSATGDTALSESKVAEIDAKDAHVMLAAQEHAVDILVTSNVKHFVVLEPVCSVEPPTQFLRRWV